jgi:hypothetical protein
MAYGDCPDEIYADIEASTTAAHLKNTMHQWGNKINKECYFFIGQKFLGIYKNTYATPDLDNAIKFLSYACKEIRPYDPIHSTCQKTLADANLLYKNANEFNRMGKYMQDPFYYEYPKDSIQKFKDQNLPIIPKIEQVHQQMIQFETALKELLQFQNYQNAKKTLVPIEKMANQGIDINKPKVQAVKNLCLYYRTIEQQNRLNTTEYCVSLEKSLQYLRMAQAEIPNFLDKQNIEYQQQRSCLEILLKQRLASLMPDKNNFDTFNDRLTQCKKYQSIYNKHGGSKRTRALVGVVNNLITFYEACQSLSNPPPDTHPAMPLHNFMKEMEYQNDNYSKQLFNMAGFYNARYFYDESVRLLYAGPGDHKEESLEKIELLTRNFYLYHQFIYTNLDIQQMVALLKDFFALYQRHPSKAKLIADQINEQIKAAWHIADYL